MNPYLTFTILLMQFVVNINFNLAFIDMQDENSCPITTSKYVSSVKQILIFI